MLKSAIFAPKRIKVQKVSKSAIFCLNLMIFALSLRDQILYILTKMEITIIFTSVVRKSSKRPTFDIGIDEKTRAYFDYIFFLGDFI